MKLNRLIAIPALALAAGLSLAACGGSPPAQDVTACRLAVSSLNKPAGANSADYIIAGAMAKDPQLGLDLRTMGESLASLSLPGDMAGDTSQVGSDSTRDAGRICTADGVSWPAGDS